MFRFTIREVLWLMVVVGLAIGWWADRRALWQSNLQKADAEEKVDFLLTVLRQDGYQVDAPLGPRGPIRVPSHEQIMVERGGGHIVPPAAPNRP